MGLCKTSNFSIFTFIHASDLKFCKRSYSSYVWVLFDCSEQPNRMMRFKGSNGKFCKMTTSHFRTLFYWMLLMHYRSKFLASIPGQRLVLRGPKKI